jgi:hypothetical protein
LRAGHVEVTVPWVMDSDKYTIVLFGDSGNWRCVHDCIASSLRADCVYSEEFTIQGE